MQYAWRTRQCQTCGKTLEGHLSPTKPIRCLECGIDVAVDIATQLHQKSGPAWEKWKAGMARFAARELEGYEGPTAVER